MTEELKKIIEREIKILPKESQEAISSLDWVKVSEELEKKYQLTEDEANDLEAEIFLALVGLEDPDFLPIKIENNVGLTREDSENISKEVFQRIFTPINDAWVEKIKNSDKIKDPGFFQMINFVLSGGDYSSLLSNPTPASEERETLDDSNISLEKNLQKTIGVNDKLVI